MAFKHATGMHAGQWELAGMFLGDSRKGQAKKFAFDDGREWWLPKRFIRIEKEAGVRVRVFLPDWLYQLKLKQPEGGDAIAKRA